MTKMLIKFKKIIEKYNSWVPSRFIRIAILAIPLMFLFIGIFRIDNDFWFLINTGKHILNNGFYTYEPFSIHHNLNFISQQWLTSILFYVIYDKMNIWGMFLLILLVNGIIVYLLYKLFLLISSKRIKLSLVMTLITTLMMEICFTGATRPQIFDTLFLILELYLLELYVCKKDYRYLIGLPIISVLMINLHASIWPMIFVFLLPYLVSAIKIKYFEECEFKPLIITAVIMFVVAFINPYGIEAMTYLFKSFGVSYINDFILEMKPLTIGRFPIIYLYIFIILVSYYLNKNKKINVRYVLLFLGTLFMAFMNNRSVLFLLITGGLSLVYNLGDYFKIETFNSGNNKMVTIATFITICLWLFIYTFRFDIGTDNNIMLKAAEYLDENVKSDISVYTDYNNGQYLQWKGYKTYIDARAEVYLKANNGKEDIMKEFCDLESREIDYQDFLDKYKFDYLVVEDSDILFSYLQIDSYGYKLVYSYSFREGSAKDERLVNIYERDNYL